MPRDGRPKLPIAIVKRVTFRFRCTVEERDQLERAAAAAGTTASEWSRKILLAVAAKNCETSPKRR